MLKCFGSLSIVGEDGQADASSDIEGIALMYNRSRDGSQHVLGEVGRIEARLVTDVQNCKLVSAEPGDHVVWSAGLSQTRGYLLQQPITNWMAKTIVYRFKAIEIKQQQGELAARGARETNSARFCRAGGRGLLVP